MYLIDGNNLLGSWGGPRPGIDRRVEVVARVAEFCATHAAAVTIVFDGRPFAVSGPLQVLFPAPGKDADSVIRAIVDAAPLPAEIRLVTSDKPLYSYARTRGATILRAHEWNAATRGAA